MEVCPTLVFSGIHPAATRARLGPISALAFETGPPQCIAGLHAFSVHPQSGPCLESRSAGTYWPAAFLGLLAHLAEVLQKTHQAVLAARPKPLKYTSESHMSLIKIKYVFTKK